MSAFRYLDSKLLLCLKIGDKLLFNGMDYPQFLTAFTLADPDRPLGKLGFFG